MSDSVHSALVNSCFADCSILSSTMKRRADCYLSVTTAVTRTRHKYFVLRIFPILLNLLTEV
jgi:hypothetical protein